MCDKMYTVYTGKGNVYNHIIYIYIHVHVHACACKYHDIV